MAKSPKTEFIGARVHPETKKQLEKSGYNGAEAIEWFVHEFYSSNPKRKVKIKKDIILSNISKLESQKVEIEDIISDLKSQLDELKDDLADDYAIDDDNRAPPELVNSIEIFKNAFSRSGGRYESNLKSDRDIVKSFIDDHLDFVGNLYQQSGKSVGFDDFVELLIDAIYV